MPSLRSRVSWAGCVAVAAAGGIALAAVPAPNRIVNQAVTVSGTLTYVWHGDLSRGCAASGVCTLSGSLAVHFDGYASLTSTRRAGDLQLSGASAIARVRREDPGAQPGACVDLAPVDSVGIHLTRAARGRYRAAIDPSSASSGRCAGPLSGELSRLALTARRLPTRLPGFDLHGQARFAAGPFRGELISTVVVRPDTSNQFSSATSGSSTSALPPPARYRRVLVEYVVLRYRITGAAGSLQTAFAGLPAPYCVPLDSCGLSGALGLSLGGYRDELVVSATRDLPRRVGRSRVLGDLRAGKLDLSATMLNSTIRARVSEMTTRAGGASCRDGRNERLLLAINAFNFGPAPALPVVLANAGSPADPFRTHCPGPAGAELVGPGQSTGLFPDGVPIAAGSIPFRSLGLGRLAVVLQHPGRFSGGGYSGARGGALGFTLTLQRVRAGTRAERLPR